MDGLPIALSKAEQQGLLILLGAWALIHLGVLAAMLRSIVRNGKSMRPVPRDPDPATRHEIVWTSVSLVLVLLVALLAWRTARSIGGG